MIIRIEDLCKNCISHAQKMVNEYKAFDPSTAICHSCSKRLGISFIVHTARIALFPFSDIVATGVYDKQCLTRFKPAM